MLTGARNLMAWSSTGARLKRAQASVQHDGLALLFPGLDLGHRTESAAVDSSGGGGGGEATVRQLRHLLGACLAGPTAATSVCERGFFS